MCTFAGAVPARLRLALARRRGHPRDLRLHQGLPAVAARAAGVERAVAGLHGGGGAARAGRRGRRRRAGRQPAAAAQQGQLGLPAAASAEVSYAIMKQKNVIAMPLLQIYIAKTYLKAPNTPPRWSAFCGRFYNSVLDSKPLHIIQ